MQSAFVIITKLIASKNYFFKEVFCNNFGRDGNAHLRSDLLNKHEQADAGACDVQRGNSPIHFHRVFPFPWSSSRISPRFSAQKGAGS